MFVSGEFYSRKDIYRIVNVPEERQKGCWNTGYTKYDNEFYVFITLNGEGRTGHNYNNHWEGDLLYWRGKTNSHINQNRIKEMLEGNINIHIFTREDSKNVNFKYEGLGEVADFKDEKPVLIYWKIKKVLLEKKDVVYNEDNLENDSSCLIFENNENMTLYEKDDFINWMKVNANISPESIKKYNSGIKNTLKALSKYYPEYKDICNIKDIDEINKIQKLCKEITELREKNKRGNNMYGASLNWYKKYLEDIKSKNILICEKKEKEAPFIKDGIKQWKRDSSIVDNIIKNSNYKCEYDQKHEYFKSNKTQKNYVEGHHLIPMEYQDKFKYSLDVPSNVVSLCVVCHKMLHHGLISDKEIIVKKLYGMRKEYLNGSGLEIQFDELMNFYE